MHASYSNDNPLTPRRDHRDWLAHGGPEWTSQDVRPGAGLRLYRAIAGAHWILAKDGSPGHRIPVPLT